MAALRRTQGLKNWVMGQVECSLGIGCCEELSDQQKILWCASKFKDALQALEQTAGVMTHAVVLSQDNLQRGHRMSQVIIMLTTT